MTIDVLNDVWAQYKTTYEAEKVNRQVQLGKTQAEIESLKARLLRSKDEGLTDFYEQELKMLLKKKEELEEQKFDRHYTDEELGTATRIVFQTLENPISMWQSPNWHDRRTIALMYFEDKLRFDRDIGFGTASLASPIKLMQEFSSQKIPLVEMGAVKPRVKKKPLNVYKRSPARGGANDLAYHLRLIKKASLY